MRLKTYRFVKIDVSVCESANSQEATSGRTAASLAGVGVRSNYPNNTEG
ncbi:MAG: hypothetical protein HC849_13550 [Oscillatoriales cyanobacterium RU_3_3]|nr:hypothetical protein [Oscillatoriales cyanobacterium RU_3_3]